MQSSLKGDSGSPLMSNDSEFTEKNEDDAKPWVIYGIASWTFMCARVETPGVFTKVSHYVNWIQTIITCKSHLVYNTLDIVVSLMIPIVLIVVMTIIIIIFEMFNLSIIQVMHFNMHIYIHIILIITIIIIQIALLMKRFIF